MINEMNNNIAEVFALRYRDDPSQYPQKEETVKKDITDILNSDGRLNPYKIDATLERSIAYQASVLCKDSRQRIDYITTVYMKVFDDHRKFFTDARTKDIERFGDSRTNKEPRSSEGSSSEANDAKSDADKEDEKKPSFLKETQCKSVANGSPDLKWTQPSGPKSHRTRSNGSNSNSSVESIAVPKKKKEKKGTHLLRTRFNM